MIREQAIEKVQEIFRDIFDDQGLVINDMMSANDIQYWDSLNHVNLLSSIEKEFKIKFGLGELAELTNVGVLLDLIMRKLTR